MSLKRWVSGFTHYLAVERRLSLHTQRVYERDVRAWLKALPQRSNAEVAALLTRDNVVKFLAQSRAAGLSPALWRGAWLVYGHFAAISSKKRCCPLIRS